MKPITIDQRLEVATVSQDVIIIDDDDNNGNSSSAQNPSLGTDTVASDLSKVVTHVDSPSSDSGCVIMNREEVGIHSSNNFDHSQCSSDTGVDEEDALINGAAKCSNKIPIAATNNYVAPTVTTMAPGANREQLLIENKNASMINKLTASDSSKSSCSGMAVEQLTSDAKKNQRSTVSFVDQNNQSKQTTSSPQEREKFIRVVNTSRLTSEPESESPEFVDSIAPMMSPYMAVHKKKMEQMTYSRKSLPNSRNTECDADRHYETSSSVTEDDEQEFLNDLFGSKSTPLRTPTGKSSVKVVHPTRHAYDSAFSSELDREESSNNLQDLSEKLPVSVSLTAIKSSNLLLQSSDLNERLSNESEPNESEDEPMPLEVRRLYAPVPNAVPLRSSFANKSHTHERTVRFADDVISNDTSEADEKVQHVNVKRRHGKYDVPILDAAVPSTIQERKTYIKPASALSKSQHQQQQKKTRNISVMPTAKSPPPPTPQSSSSTMIQSPYSPTLQPSHSSINITAASVAREPSPIRNISQSQQQSQQQQPYRVFISGTELDVGLSVNENPLSDSPIQKDVQIDRMTSTQSTSTTSFCESDNNLMINVTKQSCSSTSLATSSQLPAAIVHPMGLDMSAKQTNLNNRLRANTIQISEQLISPSSDVSSPDVRLITVDQRESIEKLPAITVNNSDGNAAELLEIYKKLRNHLEIMGYKPEEDSVSSNVTTTKRPRVRDNYDDDEAHGLRQQRESGGEEMDEGDASLPFKKRRKLPVYSDTLQIIKEEDSDSQQPFDLESPSGIPPVQNEVEVTTTCAPSPPAPIQTVQSYPHLPATTIPSIEENQQPIAHVECVSYPPTPMLSIANIVEYLPFRAYSTFKTPAPEIAPVRFNLVPQPVMINTPSSSTQNNGNTSANNKHVETTFNIIPSQSQINANPNSSTTTATNMVTSENEPYLPSQMQAIPSEVPNSGFNVAPNTAAIQYRQAFHPNQPYTTYSIQPHQNTNNLPPNFDLQNMFNLHNYQMNPQNYHNLIQNSRINLQEKQAILLNDFIQYDANNPPSQSHQPQPQSTNQSQPQPHPQQHQQLNQQQPKINQQIHPQQSIQSSNSQMHTTVSTTISNVQHNKTNTISSITTQRAPITTPRTKAARKMVSDTTTHSNVPIVEKVTKTNRVTRSSNRTTRAQSATTIATSTEQKSPRRKTNRHK